MEDNLLFYNGALEKCNGEWRMKGVNCPDCGHTSYPVTERCTFCGSRNVESVDLSTSGTIYAFNIVRVPVAGYAPNLIGGLIDLPEGIRLYGQIRAPLGEVRIGMKVKLETGPLYTDKDGKEVFGFYYIPDTEGV